MRKVCLRALLLTALLAGFLGASFRSAAQSYQVLVDWDANWFYDQSGRELGTTWRPPTYVPDGFWGQGPGLLGFEDTTIYPQPFMTQLQLGITNTYLRTSFNFAGSTAGLILVATNLIDDGAVIYLNGTEVGRFRVPANQNAATFAGDQPAEGTYDVLIISNLTPLRTGANVVAVEVHQSSATSSDLAYGMQLVAIRSSPLSITNQPQSQFPITGDAFALSVGVSGGPVAYRWYKDGVINNQQTNAAWNFTGATAANNGNYFVTVSNVLGMVTSTVARVVVLADTVGPRVFDATVDTNTYARFGGVQTIAIGFTESLFNLLSTNPANFSVYFGTNYATKVTFTNVTVTFGLRPTIHLWMSGPNWKTGSNYWVLINNVVDTKTNYIASNTKVGVGWPILSNLTSMADNWFFHANYVFDTDIYTTSPAWYATNYTGYTNTDNWGLGHGILYFDPDSTGLLCAGDSYGTLISFQPNPTLFRRSFNVPQGLNLNGQLKLRYIVDDGMVLYLNGKDVHEYNANPGPVGANTGARGAVNALCITNVSLSVSNLFPGVNYMAAAVVQAIGDSADTVFGLEMDYVSTQISPTPANPPTNQCQLVMTRTGPDVRLNWNTNFNGMFLQYKTNMDVSFPWITLSAQSNGLVVPCSGQTRLWRLYNYK
jgi:hypothetical protein